MKFKPVILEYVKNKELKWLGKLLIKGLFDGEHEFRIEVISSNKVKFIQKETFKGLLVPLFSSVLNKTKKGFELMNTKLKYEAENSRS